MPRDRTRKMWTAVLALGIAFFLVHLASLTPAPYDLDGVNFALAVRHFDVTKHQPHPPGYPVFVWLGTLAHKALTPWLATPGAVPTLGASKALAIVSAAAGSLAIMPLLLVCTAIDPDRRRALLAALVTLTAPVFWFSASRSLSDVPGLTGALCAQALCAIAICPDRVALWWPPAQRFGDRLRQDDRVLAAWLFACGSVAGVVLGLRAQTLALTGPWLVAAWWTTRRSGIRDAAAIGCGFVAGASAWAIPLAVAQGGRAYLKALGEQASEDLELVDMVALDPAPAKIAGAGYDTFIRPWGNEALAICMTLLAAAGLVALWRHDRRAVLLLALGIAPYIAGHMLFHETRHIRYALPLVPAIAVLAVRGLDAMVRPRLSTIAAGVLAGSFLLIAAPAAVEAARDGSPFYRAYFDLRSRAARSGERRPVIGMHHSIALALRGESWPVEVVPVDRNREVIDVESRWLSGEERPVWFLASSRRTDLALVDPASRHLVRRYRWRRGIQRLLTGARPGGVDWHEINAPAWFAGEGWSLTPEVGGQTELARRRGQPARASVYVRRRDDAATLMIGGRNRGDAPARVVATAQGRPLATWDIAACDRFLQFLTVPADVLAEPVRYVRIGVRASGLGGNAPANVAFDQLDVRSGTRPLVGFGQGWYETELDTETGTVWRWSSDAAVLRIRSFGRSVRLRVAGESAAEFGRQGQVIRLRAGNTLIRDVAVAGPFAIDLDLPSSLLDRNDGRVLIEARPSFVPRETSLSSDTRRLAVRVFGVSGTFLP